MNVGSIFRLVFVLAMLFSAIASERDVLGQSSSIEYVRGMQVVSFDEMATTSSRDWRVFLVAVRDYKENISRLKFTESDVDALRELFIKIGTPPENITILSKTLPAHDYYPSKENIMSQFDKFLQSLDENSVAFVYFSGHGFNAFSNGSEKSYFAPIDFDRSRSDYEKTAICLNDDVLSRLSNSKARFRWLCVDACCNYIGATRDLDSVKLSMKDVPIGVLFQQSCEDGKVALEGVNPDVVKEKRIDVDLSATDNQHGLFTKSLLEALAGNESLADRNNDRQVTLSEVIVYVERKVDEYARLYHNQNQRPQHRVSEAKNLDDFILFTDVSNSKARLLAQKAKELLEAGKFEDALAAIRSARELVINEYKDDEVRILYEWAKRLHEDRKLDLARATVEMALEIDPNHTPSKILKRVIENTSGSTPPSEPKPGEPMSRDIAGIETIFRWCPAGSYIMGSPEYEFGRFSDEPQHQVEIKRGFWLAETPVTVAAFRAFVNDSGYLTVSEQGGERFTWRKPGNSSLGVSFTQEDTHPVCCLSWFDAQAYVRWLNENYARAGERFQLPSEEHWEYACRAGGNDSYLQSRFNGADTNWWNVSRGNGDRRVSGAWSDGYRFTSPVDAFDPNSWGFRDMLGNVQEWCSDYYASDPRNPNSRNVSFRVLRGGGWCSPPEDCRPAWRWAPSPEWRKSDYGFRVELITVE